MRRIIYLFLATIVAISCKGKAEVVEPITPEISVEITLPSGVTPPESYVLLLDGEKIEVTEGRVEYLGELPESGEYDVELYSEAQGVTMKGNVASLDVDSSGAITSEPEWFCFGRSKCSVSERGIEVEDIVLEPMVRELKYQITITTGYNCPVTNTIAEIKGVAGALDCATGEVVGEGYSIAAKLEEMTCSESVTYSGSVRLLGVCDNVQLYIVLSLEDGREKLVEVDLSEDLKDFNSDKSAAKSITKEVVTDPDIETSTDGTIGGWEGSDEGEFDVE